MESKTRKKNMGKGSYYGERYKRQFGLIGESQISTRNVLVIGVGGIGSWLTLLLAKMGIQHITVFDYDKVEDHNVASQLYDQKQVGEHKVLALKSFIARNVGLSIGHLVGKFDDSCLRDDFSYSVSIDRDTIIIIAVDSMKERKKIADVLKFEMPLALIDGRMGGEQLEVYTYQSCMEYMSSLQDIGEPSHDICTERSIVYNTAVIGGIICSQVKKVITGQDFKKNIVMDLKTMSLLTNL